VTSLGAAGLKNRCRIPCKSRDFAALQNARPKEYGMHDLFFDSEQGKEIDKIQNDQIRCWARIVFYSIGNTGSCPEIKRRARGIDKWPSSSACV
jgi:hypothetical protein